MSEAIFAPKVDVKEVVHNLFLGAKHKLQDVAGQKRRMHTNFAPSYALMYVRDITDYARQGLNNDKLIDYLGWLSEYGYIAFKRDWNRLTEEQKKEVIDLLTSEIAEEGLKHLFVLIANEFRSRWARVYPTEEIRERIEEEKDRILRAAKDYLKWRISFFDMAVQIAEVLWPKTEDFLKIREMEKEMEKEGTKDPSRYCELLNRIGKACETILRNYFNGVELANYIRDDRLKELVQKYLINGISEITI